MRGALMATTVVACLLSFAGEAMADSLALSASNDRVEEVGFVVTAFGHADSDNRSVYATIKPAGGSCGTTYGTDPGGEDVFFAEEATTGNYAVSTVANVQDAGSFLLCAWLQRYSADAVAFAHASLPVDVRTPRSSLEIKAPKKARPSKPVKLTFTGSSELKRDLYASVRRLGQRQRTGRCGGSSELDSGEEFLYGETVQGDFSFREPIDSYLVERPGRYLVCAWIEEQSLDPLAEVTAMAMLRVRARRGR